MLISGKQNNLSLQRQRAKHTRQLRAWHMTYTSSSWRSSTTLLLYTALLLLIQNVAVSTAASSTWDVVDRTNISNADPTDFTKLEALRLQLFTNYDKNLPPMAADGTPAKMQLGMTVNYIDIEELTGKMTLHAYLKVSWVDSLRKWNQTAFNISMLHLKPRDVWKPFISLVNSAGNDGDYLGDTQVLLSSEGTFLWVPPAVYTTYCHLDLSLWPYDVQTCTVRVGTWSLTKLDPVQSYDEVDYDELVQSTEWEIIKAQVHYLEPESDDNCLDFTFELARRSSMYKSIIFTPASCIVLLALSTFWLPPQMGEKILLNGIVIVIIGAFLMYFAQLLPILAENTPLVVLFYSSSMLLLSISMVIEVIVLYLSTAKHKNRLPNCIIRLLHGPLGKVLLLSQFTMEADTQAYTQQNSSELIDHVYEQTISSEPEYADYNNTNVSSNVDDTMRDDANTCQRSIQYSWILLATAVDRVCFVFYAIIFIALAIIYAV